MRPSRIPSTLLVSGVLLLVVYALGWAALLQWERRGPAPDAAGPPASAGGPMLDYRVTEASGREHVIRVDGRDPAGLLMDVNRRFGEGASVQRLEPREAAQARQQAGTAVSFAWVGLALVLPLSLILAGLRLRRRERELMGVWQALRPTLSVPIGTLQQRTGLEKAALEEHLVRLSERGWVELQYHPETGRVFDSRLSAYSLTLAFCPRCNEPANARMLADLNHVPVCPACMCAYDTGYLEKQKQDLVGRLVADSERRAGELPTDRGFSVFRYALFALLFPPIALSYALTKAS